MVDNRERKKVRDHWLELNRKYEGSGMTRADFCVQEKVTLATFDNWRAVFKKEGLTKDVPRTNRKARKQSQRAVKKQANALLPVVITQPAEQKQVIEIRTSKGHVVSVPVGVCPTILKEVFNALGDL